MRESERKRERESERERERGSEREQERGDGVKECGNKSVGVRE